MANNPNPPSHKSVNRIIVDLCLTSCPVLPAQGAASPWQVFHVLQPLVWALGWRVVQGVIKRKHNKLIVDGSQKTWRALFQCGFSSWSRAVEVVGATSTSELTKTPQVIFHNPYLLPWLFFYLDFETARSGRNGLLEGPRMVGSRSWGVIIAGCHLTVLIISAPWNICLTLAANYSHM